MESESIEITDQIFNDFIRSALSFISDISNIVYTNKKHSSVAKEIDGKTTPCSVLTVYVKSISAYNKLNIDPHFGNWNDSFIYSSEVKKIWNFLMKKYSLINEDNSEIEYLFFKCSDLNAIINTIYSSKNDIENSLTSLNLPKPNYIFANSLPGYSIVLKNEKEYQIYQDFGHDQIKENILNILKNKVIYISSEDFTIVLYHMKMKNLNLYGLSRED